MEMTLRLLDICIGALTMLGLVVLWYVVTDSMEAWRKRQREAREAK